MNLFSISQLSSYSGIKPHTIRIWEQRYSALKPQRSEGNTRYYDGTQLRRLLNIVSLMDSGHKISEICSMPDKKLFSLVGERLQSSIESDGTANYYVSQLIAAGMAYDEQYFDKLLSNNLVRFGMKKAYTEVVYPMLVRIGLMWACDSIPPAQEHFISNLLRQKLFTAIDSLPPPKTTSDKWLLFLPEDEFHEVGLLLTNYLVRLSGRQVIYLGPNVPFSSLVAAIKDTAPHNLLFFLVHFELPEVIEKYCDKLNSIFDGKKIFVSGSVQHLGEVKMKKKMEWLKSVDQLETELAK